MARTQKSSAVRKAVAVLGALAVLVAGWLLYSSVWYSPPLQARVAAADGTPVAGAIVVANWNIEGPWNGASLGQAALAEAVTDKDGRFRIPAWGPRFVPSGWIRIDEPTVRVFKPGFVPAVLKNYEDVPMRAADPIIRFRLQDKTIVLQPFHGTAPEFEAAVAPLVHSLDVIYGTPHADFCYWRQTPRLLLALQDLKLKLAAQGGGHSLRLAHQYASVASQSPCANAQQFFQDYANEQKD